MAAPADGIAEVLRTQTVPNSALQPLNLLDLSRPAPIAKAPAEAEAKPVFSHLTPYPGSYYHKVYSSSGTWTGIEGVVTLGKPQADPHRKGGNAGSLDSFCTYLGASPGKHGEVDAGLTWDVTVDKQGKVDTEHKAWRPFWRNGHWHNAPAEQRYYWRPGETVKMTLDMVAPGKLQLTVSDLGDHPKRVFKTEMSAPKFVSGQDVLFKRVDSIDQSGREGKQVLPTHSFLHASKWDHTSVVNKNGDHVPLSPQQSRVIDDPPGHVHVTSSKAERLRGGETVDLEGHSGR